MQYEIKDRDEVQTCAGPLFKKHLPDWEEPIVTCNYNVMVYLAPGHRDEQGEIEAFAHNHGYPQEADAADKAAAIKAKGVIDLTHWTTVYATTDRERYLQNERDLEDERDGLL
jgi:hypothetical protein